MTVANLWDAGGRYRDRLELEAARWLCERGLGAKETASVRAVRYALERCYLRRTGRPLPSSHHDTLSARRRLPRHGGMLR